MNIIMSLIKKAKFITVAAILTAFLTLSFSFGMVSAASVVKRGGEKNPSATAKSDKAEAKKSVERSAPSQSSRPNDAVRNSPSARPSSPSSGLTTNRPNSAPVSVKRPDSSANRTSVTQNRQTQESRSNNAPQREQAARPAPSQAARPDNNVRNVPSVIQNRPADNSPQREQAVKATPNPTPANRPNSPASSAVQNRPAQEVRTDNNRPQREQAARPTQNVTSAKPNNPAPSVTQNRPAQQVKSDNRPQRESARDDSASRTVTRPPANNNSRPQTSPATPQTRVEERSSLGTIFNRGRQEPARTEATRPGSTVTRTPSDDRQRVETRSPARVDNRPQRVETGSRPNTTTITRVQREPNKVIERVFETRRNWQTHYKSYDPKWRPQYRGGFYYYRGPIGYDPYYYGYYSFAHVPSYTYPSIYFHYGTFPYIYRDRIVILTRPARHYVFVTLDLNRIFYDDYYLTRDYIPYKGYVISSSARQSLRNTLDDIQRAWEHGDNNRLMRHAVRGKRIDVFSQDSYSYSINYDDYRDMTRDAMATIDTVDFEFTSVRMRSPNEVVAYGLHNYYNSANSYGTIYVSYTLERIGSKWYITEVGSSPYRFDT